MIKVMLLFLFLFAVIGICEIIYIIKMFIYYPNTRVKNYSLVILKSGYAIRQLNYIWQKIKWHGDSYAMGIIAIVDDIDEKEFLCCQEFICDKNIVLCTAKSIVSCVYKELI